MRAITLRTQAIHRLWIAAMLFLAHPLVASTQADVTAAELQAQLAAAREEIRLLKAEIKRLNGDHADLQTEIRRLEELAGLTAKGDVVASSASLMKSVFETDSQKTTVSTNAFKLYGATGFSASQYFLSYVYQYAGQQMTSPPTGVEMVIQTFHRPHTRLSAVKTMRILVDNEPVDLPVSGYKIVQTRRAPAPGGSVERYDEELRFMLDEAALAKLARGHTGTAQLPGVDLPLSHDVMAIAKAVRERIRLGK